ncbi:hypothetical protein AHF37_04113, partial [Paragonimus kellicotti]
VAVPIAPFDRTLSVSRQHFTTSSEANQNPNLSTSHVSGSILCHEPLLSRPDINRSSPFLANRCFSVFTAASGLHSRTSIRPAEEQETASSNTSACSFQISESRITAARLDAESATELPMLI